MLKIIHFFHQSFVDRIHTFERQMLYDSVLDVYAWWWHSPGPNKPSMCSQVKISRFSQPTPNHAPNSEQHAPARHVPLASMATSHFSQRTQSFAHIAGCASFYICTFEGLYCRHGGQGNWDQSPKKSGSSQVLRVERRLKWLRWLGGEGAGCHLCLAGLVANGER